MPPYSSDMEHFQQIVMQPDNLLLGLAIVGLGIVGWWVFHHLWG